MFSHEFSGLRAVVAVVVVVIVEEPALLTLVANRKSDLSKWKV